jgi:hypothetical protein
MVFLPLCPGSGGKLSLPARAPKSGFSSLRLSPCNVYMGGVYSPCSCYLLKRGACWAGGGVGPQVEALALVTW